MQRDVVVQFDIILFLSVIIKYYLHRHERKPATAKKALCPYLVARSLALCSRDYIVDHLASDVLPGETLHALEAW